MSAAGFTLAELAQRFNAELVGDGQLQVSAVADLATAAADNLVFVAGKEYLPELSASKAGAVILSAKLKTFIDRPALLTTNPYLLFARIAVLLHPDEDLQKPPSIAASASIDPTAVIDPTAIIAPNAVIEAGAQIHAHAYIGPCCVVRARAIVGASSKLVSNVSIGTDCILGQRVLVHPSAVIGADGFGFAPDGQRWQKIPQLGRVLIGDDVEIGACTTIDRGALRDTIIESGVKFDNQIQIAHNVKIRANTAMAANSAIAGSVEIGEHCMIGGMTGIVGHLKIADNVQLNAFSQVTHAIEEAGQYASGTPLEPIASSRRNWVRMKQLDEMAKRLSILEKKIAQDD
ncbi:MAG: UDP-3-O-(3-hydroxymyristoyl)glucosamine N-acyltransferase [Gammaproteobacteria bacterium]|nr:UDP-3-O-(3-hydroxymyristoyl)glucosamine N-acyltransferase [Gammaproteobacteria bacterium]